MKEFILPLKDLVIQPGLTVPIYLDNQISVACMDAAVAGSRQIILRHSINGIIQLVLMNCLILEHWRM